MLLLMLSCGFCLFVLIGFCLRRSRLFGPKSNSKREVGLEKTLMKLKEIAKRKRMR